MTKTQNFLVVPAIAALMLVGGGVAGYVGLAAAQDSQTGTSAIAGMFHRERGPHVDGVITGINGSVITITADANHGGGTYSIQTSGATFTKAGASASLASFAVGEKVWAEGTIDGQNVTATKVTDRPAFGPGGRGGKHGKGPGVMGTVSALNGSTITVTGMDGQSYTVEAGSASVQKMVAGSLSDIVVGDRIGVQGSVSGTSVTATNIMDDVPEKPAHVQ